MTLQRRVLGYLLLAAAVSCLLTFGLGLVLVRRQVAGQRVAALQSQATTLSTQLPEALAGGQVVDRITARGVRRVRPVVRAAVLAAIPATGDAQGTIHLRGHALLYAARTSPGGGRVVLIRGASLAFADWRPFLTSLALAWLGGVLLAFGLSYLLSRRLTRPIGALSEATQRLARGEGQIAVPVEGEDELARLGEAFNRMAGELEQAREAQRRFLESVSHELKTPLTSLRGYAEALEEDALPAPEAGAVIAAEAVRLERLVRDLLDLARLGRAGFTVRRETIDLGAIAATAVARHLPRARELGVELEAIQETPPPSPALGVGDGDRLLQAISNLIENALRLTPEGGSVTVGTGPGRVLVRDTGPGLADEDLPRAFERFYLTDRYRSERAVGSGLGLAIVAELIGAMGGHVEAGHAPGGGAQFTLRLPVPTGTVTAPAGAAGPASS